MPHFECGAFDHSATSPVTLVGARWRGLSHSGNFSPMQERMWCFLHSATRTWNCRAVPYASLRSSPISYLANGRRSGVPNSPPPVLSGHFTHVAHTAHRPRPKPGIGPNQSRACARSGPDNEEHRRVQHSGDRRARTRELSTRQGRKKGSRRSLSIATPVGVRRDRLPPAMAFRLKGPSALSATSHMQPPSPARPPQCLRNIDDVITSCRRIILAPGDTKPDLQIDARYLLQHHIPARQISRPFRRKVVDLPSSGMRGPALG